MKMKYNPDVSVYKPESTKFINTKFYLALVMSYAQFNIDTRYKSLYT